MMKVGFHIQFSAECLEIEIVEEVSQYLKANSMHLIRRGVRPLDWVIQAGLNGDDFIKNMYTVACTAKGYRIPRFVKRYLLRKNHNTRLIRRGRFANI